MPFSKDTTKVIWTCTFMKAQPFNTGVKYNPQATKLFRTLIKQPFKGIMELNKYGFKYIKQFTHKAESGWCHTSSENDHDKWHLLWQYIILTKCNSSVCSKVVAFSISLIWLHFKLHIFVLCPFETIKDGTIKKIWTELCLFCSEVLCLTIQMYMLHRAFNKLLSLGKKKPWMF